MQLNIAKKLRAEVESGVIRETQVVYLMASIRKILEQLDETAQFGRLRFFCDWVLHSRLSRPPAQEVVGILQTIYDSMVAGTRLPQFSEAMLLVRFELLKDNLSTFLRQFDIKDFTQDTNAWVAFICIYSKVVADCPLEMPNNFVGNIRKISIHLEISDKLIDDHLPYKINWNFEAREDLPPASYFILNTYSVAAIGGN